MVIVAALGITGGISIAVWNFGTAPGSSVPPGIAAMARSIQPVWLATYQASVVAPVSLRKLRRVGMVPPPMGTAVGCQQPHAPIPGAEVPRVELRIQAQAREPPGSCYYPAMKPAAVPAPHGKGNRSECQAIRVGACRVSVAAGRGRGCP